MLFDTINKLVHLIYVFLQSMFLQNQLITAGKTRD